MEVFGFGGIANTEYSVLVQTNYSAEYSAETGIRMTTITHTLQLHCIVVLKKSFVKAKLFPHLEAWVRIGRGISQGHLVATGPNTFCCIFETHLFFGIKKP
jgi:hypothetical protein